MDGQAEGSAPFSPGPSGARPPRFTFPASRSTTPEMLFRSASTSTPLNCARDFALSKKSPACLAIAGSSKSTARSVTCSSIFFLYLFPILAQSRAFQQYMLHILDPVPPFLGAQPAVGFVHVSLPGQGRPEFYVAGLCLGDDCREVAGQASVLVQ